MEMTTRSDEDVTGAKGNQPYQVRLPGFVVDEDIGLGDAMKKLTYAIGIKPCGGCVARAEAMNRWMVFSGR